MNLSFHHREFQNLLELLKAENLSLSELPNGSWDLDWQELENLLFLFHKDPVTISLSLMYSLSFLVGFVGNVMSLRMLTKKRKGRIPSLNATRILLINLAVCDLMVVCVCMPITVANLVYKAWVYGDFLCRAVPFTQAVAVSTSVLSLTVISLNRYYSVHNPLNARSFFTHRKILNTILVIWVFSSGICLPLIFMNKMDEISVPQGPPLAFPICREIWPQERVRQAYSFLLFGTLYCLPVLFNMVICCLTVHRLWSPTRQLRDCSALTRTLPSSRLTIRKKVAQMVVALVLLFAISWLPIYTVDIWIEFNGPKISQDVASSPWLLQLRPFAQWLSLTNSSLNPICYCFIGNLSRSAKEMRNRYHKKMVSLLNISLSEKSLSSSAPELLSLRSSAGKEPRLVVAIGRPGKESYNLRTQV
ncbi:QRFP-like peptide receptor [Tiliqua scincoides]|uniref:QRFP-like peptide receptor n=1 Tax=Tiliqua scincoides TaxID=71010 RepID=UPI003461D360